MQDQDCLNVGKNGCEYLSKNRKGISICTDCGVPVQNIFNCGIADGSFGDEIKNNDVSFPKENIHRKEVVNA